MRQVSFDPLDYTSGEAAKKARDEYYRDCKKDGKEAKRWVLRGQLQKYSSYGVEDGRVRDVYYVSVYTE
jgi:hypothetical protein